MNTLLVSVANLQPFFDKWFEDIITPHAQYNGFLDENIFIFNTSAQECI
jgi:hypothetical protein